MVCLDMCCWFQHELSAPLYLEVIRTVSAQTVISAWAPCVLGHDPPLAAHSLQHIAAAESAARAQLRPSPSSSESIGLRSWM